MWTFNKPINPCDWCSGRKGPIIFICRECKYHFDFKRDQGIHEFRKLERIFMKPHKHADLIKAWADGAEIQVLIDNNWHDAASPCWDFGCEYRAKPKNDTYICHYKVSQTSIVEYCMGRHSDQNLRLTFTNDKLTKAEIL